MTALKCADRCGEAKFWELRAALDLARLWRDRGQPAPTPPYGPPITLEQAKRVMAAAELEAVRSLDREANDAAGWTMRGSREARRRAFEAFRLRAFVCAGLMLLTIAIALLIAPTMDHRIVERGQGSPRVLALATLFAGMALLPVAIALALDIFAAMERIAAAAVAASIAGGFFGLAMLCWYALAGLANNTKGTTHDQRRRQTHASGNAGRSAFDRGACHHPGCSGAARLPVDRHLHPSFRATDAAALCCIALAIVLLMAPASIHRIAFGGQDDPEFVKLASLFVVGSPFPRAVGIALDTYVAAGRAVKSEAVAVSLAAAAIIILLGVWYALPVWRRGKRISDRLARPALYR